MINQLHNPALRIRHWEQIQKVLNLVINPEEPFTLQTLTEIDAFSRLEEVQEISGQASSEHSLELILKKVCSLFLFLFHSHLFCCAFSNFQDILLQVFYFDALHCLPLSFSFIIFTFIFYNCTKF